jgi:hypothetical protein
MRLSRPLAAALVIAGAMAGCAASSHLGSLQPPRPRTMTARLSPERWTAAPRLQLGIDVDFYNWRGLNVAQSAAGDVAYIRSLHANAMSVSFPFFMHGWYSDGVYGNGETPSPADLAIVAKDAADAGLYFSIRPLLDEGNLRSKGGRTHWSPANIKDWFASYERFLKPYAEMAQRERIPELVIGVEFDAINNSPYWTKLATYLRKYYSGTLSYSNNWQESVDKRVNRAGVVQTIDAYPIMNLGPDATPAQVTAGWASYLQSEARGIVISEIGIASQDGAYTRPFRLTWRGEPLDPKIQYRWFTGACNALAMERDTGIYFWSILFDQGFSAHPTASDPTTFVGGSGAAAISRCFERLN